MSVGTIACKPHCMQTIASTPCWEAPEPGSYQEPASWAVQQDALLAVASMATTLADNAQTPATAAEMAVRLNEATDHPFLSFLEKDASHELKTKLLYCLDLVASILVQKG